MSALGQEVPQCSGGAGNGRGSGGGNGGQRQRLRVGDTHQRHTVLAFTSYQTLGTAACPEHVK